MNFLKPTNFMSDQEKIMNLCLWLGIYRSTSELNLTDEHLAEVSKKMKTLNDSLPEREKLPDHMKGGKLWSC